MVRQRRSPRRHPGLTVDPFDFLQYADEQQLEEMRRRWARMPRGAAADAAAATGRSRTILEITFTADGVPVFSNGMSLQDVWADADDDAYRGGGLIRAVRASRAAIRALAVAAPGETSKEAECAVCLEGLREGGKVIRTMPCPNSHAFHEACIIEWLGVSRVCPLCRFALPPRGEESTDDEDDESDAE